MDRHMHLRIELPCSFVGCDKPRRGRQDYCAAHQKQISLGKPLSPLAYRPWTPKEEMAVREWYQSRPLGKVDLDELCKSISRNRQVICRKAKDLGLTVMHRKWSKGRPKKYATDAERSSAMSERVKKHQKEHGHPRGALGMKHSNETKDVLSAKSKAFASSLSKGQRREIVIKSMKTRVANGTLVQASPHGSWKAGWRVVGGRRVYFRSRWEANYARYLEWLKSNGEIKEWEHEPETFWFSKIKRGCVSYLPDFRVTTKSGAIEYHEVKGWMDSRSKTKIRRMKKYHPTVKLIVIASAYYGSIAKKLSRVVPEWEFDPRKGRL
jgi:hypothetical protein